MQNLKLQHVLNEVKTEKNLLPRSVLTCYFWNQTVRPAYEQKRWMMLPVVEGPGPAGVTVKQKRDASSSLLPTAAPRERGWLASAPCPLARTASQWASTTSLPWENAGVFKMPGTEATVLGQLRGGFAKGETSGFCQQNTTELLVAFRRAALSDNQPSPMGLCRTQASILKKKVSAGSLANVNSCSIGWHAEGSVPVTHSFDKQQQSSITSHGCGWFYSTLPAV